MLLLRLCYECRHTFSFQRLVSTNWRQPNVVFFPSHTKRIWAVSYPLLSLWKMLYICVIWCCERKIVSLFMRRLNYIIDCDAAAAAFFFDLSVLTFIINNGYCYLIKYIKQMIAMLLIVSIVEYVWWCVESNDKIIIFCLNHWFFGFFRNIYKWKIIVFYWYFTITLLKRIIYEIIFLYSWHWN